MSERVLLAIRCRRNWHVVLTTTGDPAAPRAEAGKLAVGRKRSSWTPGSWQVTAGHAGARRYGCACGQSWLIADGDILRWLSAGYTEVVLPAARIGRIGPVRLGANKQ